jgi:hypothetical protein
MKNFQFISENKNILDLIFFSVKFIFYLQFFSGWSEFLYLLKLGIFGNENKMAGCPILFAESRYC